MRKRLADLGYEMNRRGRITIVSKPLEERFLEILSSPGPIGTESGMRGRSSIRILKPDMVVRTLMHGGIFRRITRSRFISAHRSFRELEINAHLLSHNVPTPEIIALRLTKKGIFTTIDVISKMVPDSADMLSYLQENADVDNTIFHRTGTLIRQMHESGVYHADLHVKNILITGNESPWLLDLDKAYRFASPGFLLKRKNIRRFIKSCIKWQTKGLITLPEGWQSALLNGYNHQS